MGIGAFLLLFMLGLFLLSLRKISKNNAELDAVMLKLATVLKEIAEDDKKHLAAQRDSCAGYNLFCCCRKWGTRYEDK